MTPELVREIVEEVCESFFNPGATRRWVADQHPRDENGKFASGGGGKADRDSPEVDSRRATRQIRRLKKDMSATRAKIDAIDAKKAQVKELAGKLSDAHRRAGEARAKAEEHKAKAKALRDEYQARWGKKLK